MDMPALRAKLESIGQGQVLRFWEELSADERMRLGAQLAELDMERAGT